MENINFKEFATEQNFQSHNIMLEMNREEVTSDYVTKVAKKTTLYIWDKYVMPNKSVWANPYAPVKKKPSKYILLEYVEKFIYSLIDSGEFSSAAKIWRQKELGKNLNIKDYGTAYWIIKIMNECYLTTSGFSEPQRQRYSYDPISPTPEDKFVSKEGDIFRFEKDITNFVKKYIK